MISAPAFQPHPCAHCGDPGLHEWTLRDGARFHVCAPCDLALIAMVARFTRRPNAAQLLEAYGASRAD